MSRTRKIVVGAVLAAAATGQVTAGTLTGDCSGWQMTGTNGFSFNYQINVIASLVDANTNVVVSTSSAITAVLPGGPPPDAWAISNTWPDPVPTGNYIIEAIEQVINVNTGNVVLTFDHVFPTGGGVLACVGGGEGCTPGYWKQPHHFDDWPAPYTPGTLFSDVFDDAFPGKTLLTVLSQPASSPPGPNQLNNLGRHTVAALLNGASDGVNFPIPAAQVIKLFDMTWPGTNDAYNALKDQFADANEAGCPLNGGADVNDDGLVGLTDLMQVLGAWGSYELAPDIDHSGIVGFDDLVEVLVWWNA